MDMEPEDGCLAVVDVNDESTVAFATRGIENLKELLDDLSQTRNRRRLASSVEDCASYQMHTPILPDRLMRSNAGSQIASCEFQPPQECVGLTSVYPISPSYSSSCLSFERETVILYS
jgi:hypothetical protein